MVAVWDLLAYVVLSDRFYMNDYGMEYSRMGFSRGFELKAMFPNNMVRTQFNNGVLGRVALFS